MTRLILEGPENREIEPVIYKDNNVTALSFEYLPFSDKTESHLKDKLKRTNDAEVLTSTGEMHTSYRREITSEHTGHSMNDLKKLFKKEICSEYLDAIEKFKPDSTVNRVPPIIDIFGHDKKSIEYFKEICPEKFSDIEIPTQNNTVNLSNIIDSIINYKDTFRDYKGNTRHKENLSSLKTYLNP